MGLHHTCLICKTTIGMVRAVVDTLEEVIMGKGKVREIILTFNLVHHRFIPSKSCKYTLDDYGFWKDITRILCCIVVSFFTNSP